jgi:hypothetical protein
MHIAMEAAKQDKALFGSAICARTCDGTSQSPRLSQGFRLAGLVTLPVDREPVVLSPLCCIPLSCIQRERGRKQASHG